MTEERARSRGALLLVTACLLVYANGLTGSFTYDDKAIIRDNPRIQAPQTWTQIFTTSYFGSPRGSGTAYRPVLFFSYALHWWSGLSSAVGFHVVNLLLHVGATLLLSALLLRLDLPPPAVLAAGLLFAVHPIHVEAVTSLVGRGETLTAVLVLAMLHLCLRALPGTGVRPPALFGAFCCYALAIFTKESGAVAPALAFLLFLFQAEGNLLRRIRVALRRGAALYGGCALILAGTFLLRTWLLGGALKGTGTAIFEVENPLAPLPGPARAINACVIFFRYLGRAVLPLHLSADESAWSIPVVPIASALGIISVVLLLALAVLALARLSRVPGIAFGILFFCVALLPTGNLLFPIGTVLAERTTYLPSAGVCVALALLLVGGAAAFSALPPARLSLLTAVVLFWGARTIVRNAVWRSDEALFANSVATSPGSSKAHYNLGFILAHNSDERRALFHYVRAVQIYDRYWDAWAGKGRMEKDLGQFQEAEKSYAKAVDVYPAYENGHFGLGFTREEQGDLAGAEGAYRRGLERLPKSLPLLYRLALLRSKLRGPDAFGLWQRALSLAPNSAAVRAGYSGWLFGEERTREAVREAREALRRDPRNLTALRLLAERAARDRLLLSEGLAREKIFRISRSPEDLAMLLRVVGASPSYENRFRTLRPSLEKLAPRAFRRLRSSPHSVL